MLSGLVEYLDSIKARDPAPRSRWEVLLYPACCRSACTASPTGCFRGDSISSRG
jgi:hypothetical protein